MNWVGGSRTRVLIKQEKRKQKEYFEKKRLKSKMKLLGVSSPVKNSAVSLDLLNLYVVNQISCQKKTSEIVRKPTHVNMNRDIKMHIRQHDLELPMTPPCVPSNLCIDDRENNVHCQRLGGKEELGLVQSSQAMDSCRSFKPQFSRIENCSFTPSFSAEFSSNSHIAKQNFTSGIAPSSQKVAFEQSRVNSNVNYFNFLVYYSNESQDACSPYKTAQFGELFERLNSPGNRNFLPGRPARVMNEDCVNMDEKRHSDFIIGKQPVQHIWGENRKEISNFLEDVNQPTCSLLPENSDSFINGNVINLLSLDQQRIKKPFDKYGYNSMGDICAVASYDKNYSSDRCIGSIFTGPEFNFSSPNLNKTSYLEKCQPNKNYQKEYNNEGNNSGMSFEKDCYPASSEKKGKFERDQPEKIPQIEVQKYPVNHMSNTPFKELHSKKSWDFGLDENLMEKGGMCSIKGIPTSTKKICQYNNDDSSQTSQSSSYSPRPTDSCFSSSSEMLSEDEDQTLQQIEDSSRRSIKTEETTNNSYLERMAEFPHDRIIESNVKSDKQNENFHPSLVKDNTDPFAQSQSNSAHVSQHKTSDPCILQPVRCDAWVQTEHEPVMKEKLDAAVQCDIISECKCRSDVSSLCNAERCSENIKADTTGGQEILKNNCYSEISA